MLIDPSEVEQLAQRRRVHRSTARCLNNRDPRRPTRE
jgi:hypothetical protein